MPNRFSSLLLVAALAISTPLSAAGEKATEAQLKQLKRSIASLESRLRKQQSQQKGLQGEVREQARKISAVAAQRHQLDQQLAELNRELAGFDEHQAELKAVLKARAGHIARLLRQQYQQGPQPRLKLLLSQKDPAELDRMLRYYDFASAELADQLGKYQQQLEKLEATQRDAARTRDEIAERQQTLSEQEAQLQSLKKQREQSLAQLQKQARSDSAKLADLRADRKRLQGVLEELRKALDLEQLATQDVPFKQLKGKLSWPLKGKVLRSYGSQRNGIRYDGLLIAAREGEPVKAVQHGRVVFAEWLRGYGMLLILDHGDGYMTLYGHNESLLRAPGDWVAAGDPVATAGQSGADQGASSYFAVRHNGRSTNPAQWLK